VRVGRCYFSQAKHDQKLPYDGNQAGPEKVWPSASSNDEAKVDAGRQWGSTDRELNTNRIPYVETVRLQLTTIEGVQSFGYSFLMALCD